MQENFKESQLKIENYITREELLEYYENDLTDLDIIGSLNEKFPGKRGISLKSLQRLKQKWNITQFEKPDEEQLKVVVEDAIATVGCKTSMSY